MLEGEEFIHLARVMRLRAGDGCEVVNGKGFLAKAKIKKIEKERAILEVDGVYEEKREGFFTVVVPILSPPKMHLIVEKGTELGVDRFLFFPAELSEKSEIKEQEMSRLKRVVIAALKQSGRLFLPEVKIIPGVDKWEIEKGDFEGDWFYGDPEEGGKGIEILGKSRRATFVSGPEKGFSEEERDKLKRMGFNPVRLNKYVLRAETAPIVAAAIHGATFLT
jgi:16S rRNA (uracil1498-N3)-methyltransferase